MTRRFQAGSVSVSTDKRYFLGKWRDENGGQHTKVLGKVREITKTQAREKLADILRPVNAVNEGTVTVSAFLKDTFFPLFERKWKASTYATNKARINTHIGNSLGDQAIGSLTREQLQAFLDARTTMAKQTVSHLRWDLKQICDLAISEGLLNKNPAHMLFVPKSCIVATKPVMTLQDVRLAIMGLPLRERLVFKLATVAGMRPGEIFALRRGSIMEESIQVHERIWKGEIDSPKTARSVRAIAISAALREDIEAWLLQTPNSGPEMWLFPSGAISKPLGADNYLDRQLKPALDKLGLGWVNYQCMRRTHASLMHALGVDVKTVADMMGHDVLTNINVYTQSSMENKMKAAETLGSALVN